jgi:Short C-terminal domain
VAHRPGSDRIPHVPHDREPLRLCVGSASPDPAPPMATFNTTLQVGESAEVVETRLVGALSKFTSSTRVTSQPGRIVLRREYRPGWATTLAILKTETLTISISANGERQSTVALSGEAEDWVMQQVQSTLASITSRPCPNCRRLMGREANLCPHCDHESRPWTRQGGFWWFPSGAGGWQWFNEMTNAWNVYEEGGSSGPRPPDAFPVAPGEETATQADPTQLGQELERLAKLHARGSLTDDEFLQAKRRMLE